MASKTETRPGSCTEHGNVQATRELPTPSFPFFVYGVRLFLAKRRPFHCPTCGSEVATN